MSEKEQGSKQQPESKSLVNLFFENAQRPIALLAYIVVLGFLVATFSLGRVTGIALLNFSPQYLIIWGALYIFNFILFRAIPAFAITFVLAFIGNIIVLRIMRSGVHISEGFQATTRLFLTPNFFSILVLIWGLYSLFVSASRPEDVFSVSTSRNTNSPRYVSLIFTEEIESTIWHLSLEPGQKRRTTSVSIMAEYSDGYLIQDITTGAVVYVKSSMIAGIVDDTNYNPAWSTPSVIPTSTPTTSSPTPTP